MGKTLVQKLEAARAEVRKENFGTDTWEAKMQIVRGLVDQINAAAPKVAYTSIDGDIFAPR